MKKVHNKKNLRRLKQISKVVWNSYLKNSEVEDIKMYLLNVQNDIAPLKGVIENVLDKYYSRKTLSEYKFENYRPLKEIAIEEIFGEFCYISDRSGAPHRLKFLLDLINLDIKDRQ